MIPRLPKVVYVFQSGLVLNAFGNGAANPFLVVYLHDARRIPLALAGAAGSVGAGCGLGATLVAGSVADRLGAKRAVLGGLALSATGFALYPLVRSPWQAITFAAIAGSGTGTWLTGQSAFVAGLVPARLRHVAFAQQRVAANLGLGLGGFAGGLIVTESDPQSFTRLFLLDAATFVAYGLVLLALRPAARPVATAPGGYRAAMRDRPFLALVSLTVVWVVSAVALLNSLFPVLAHDESGVTTHTIGALFLVNSLTIVLLQLPVSRLVEGRRRTGALAAMSGLFALWWALVLVAGARLTGRDAVVILAVAVTVFALGECLYDAVVGPLVADLAPEASTGRYLAVSGFGWQLGFIVAPAAGGVLLGAHALALPVAAGLICLAGGLGALALDRILPERVRTTPSSRERKLAKGLEIGDADPDEA